MIRGGNCVELTLGELLAHFDRLRAVDLLLASPARASARHHRRAGTVVGTGPTMMARYCARVDALLANLAARLLAFLIFFQTRTAVALLGTLMSARQKLDTLISARHVDHVTEDVASHQPAAITQLLDELDARRAALLGVACVPHWMGTVVHARADPTALRGRGAALYRRIDDFLAAVAAQLVEAYVVASVTLSTMTRLLAAMQPAGKLPSAHLGAHVLLVNTARLSAFVPTAVSLAITALVALEFFRHLSKLTTGHVLGGLATSARNRSKAIQAR